MKGTTMSTVSSWRQRRQAARNRRAFNRAIDSATTPSMRNELVAIANSDVTTLR
jgi:hypothetical protein